MELVVVIFFIASSFFLGVVWSPKVKSIFRKQKSVTPRASAYVLPPVPLRKPGGSFSEYTIEELEKHKKYLEKEYREYLHYPSLRSSTSSQLKKVLEMLAWHYDQDGMREYLEDKERNRKDLEEFDQKYNRLLKGK